MPKYKQLPVCKPCWELKYCPYGILVETMPLLPERDGKESKEPKETPEQMYVRAVETLKNTDFYDERKLWRNMFFVLFSDPNKWEELKDYNQQDVSCRIFGHACPVFFYSYDITETREDRRSSRYVPRDIMLKVVRRDNYRCRVCNVLVPDDEVEFDHIIPHAKGGPMTVENIRLLCRSCNRKKSDSMAELLND
jgi:HNH endonuclease